MSLKVLVFDEDGDITEHIVGDDEYVVIAGWRRLVETVGQTPDLDVVVLRKVY